MKLKKLIANLPVDVARGVQEIDISGLSIHSKRVAPGNLFIAKKGSTEDGCQYIEEAVASGASAILSNHFNPFLKNATQLIHPSPEMLEAELAARFYSHPSKELFTVGITGTNGKTTTAHLIKHLYDGLGFSSGLIGTVEYIVGQHRLPAVLTTPDAITNQKLLREMVKCGHKAAVMEVSSHGLAQGRSSHIDFNLALFTNLTQDHLDYHGTMEAYAREKAKLFTGLDEKSIAIVNADSAWKASLLAGCKAPVLTYGFTKSADIYADEISLLPGQTNFSVHYRGETVRIKWAMVGRYNILNCLSALAACVARDIPLASLTSLVQNFKSVPGRLEKVENRRGLSLFVDYAHTPDALENVLSCLREIKQGRIITVFGCGGDRDAGKRIKMAEAAEKGSDFSIITSDNPRSEDPRRSAMRQLLDFHLQDLLLS